ncbi:MAG: hypothetical protein GXX96_15390 [Planctomycetaceae bacterium]|nr:hypothetical protein [Planctomycetaceae bacterium]
MPYVADDDSKAARRITGIEQQLQEARSEFDRWLAAGGAPKGASELAQREREGKVLTDRLQALATALELQRALASPALHQQERTLAKASPKKMKDFGYRPVTVQFLGGVEVELMARYWCRSQARAEKGKGSYFGLVLLGVCDRTTPALASEVAQLAAALSSFEDARARLQQMGVNMSIRRIANVAYHFAQRARSQQELDGMGIEGSLAGKRVVISTDGGRLRIRRNKRGKRTKKGRARYRTDWREPKLLVIYVVNEKGRIAQGFAPVMDGTLQGPDEVFRLIEFYLRQLEVHEAKEVLFIADGATWIWNRVTELWRRLGLVGVVRCRELVDFYHVVEHVYALTALNKSWRASYRKQWATRQRRRLWRGELKAFIEDVQRLCRGKRGKDWARERDYLLRNARAGRLDYAKARRAKMPMGSGSMESAVRRVINLRLKGAGIFWHEDHAEQMLLLRAYYKSKHWQVLTNKAFASPLTNAA